MLADWIANFKAVLVGNIILTGVTSVLLVHTPVSGPQTVTVNVTAAGVEASNYSCGQDTRHVPDDVWVR